jgi:polyhydroxyalkanoate synthesis regulator phasin
MLNNRKQKTNTWRYKMIAKKIMYMVLGGLLTMALAAGAYATFAQSDDENVDDAPVESDDTNDNGSPTQGFPGFGQRGGPRDFNHPNLDFANGDEQLANALGISVDELQAAKTAVHTTIIEQAVADGVLTQEQADQILSGSASPRSGHGLGLHRTLKGEINFDELLAEALAISVDELTAAKETAQAAHMAELVEAGVLTQEQADMAQAQRDVQAYFDTDAINETIQAEYEAAVNQALADGVITQAQADLMLSHIPTFNPRSGGQGARGGGHRGPQGHHGFGPGQGSFGNGNAPVQDQDA